MCEIATILQQTDHVPIKEISHFFKEQHCELQFSDQQPFFDKLVSIFSKKTENYSIDDWDRLRLIACIFIIAFNPPINLISFQFPKDSENGYLVSSSFILLSCHHHTSEFLDFLHNYFLERLDSLFIKDPNRSFYDISSCYFFLSNSHVINNIANDLPYIEDLQLMFKKVAQLKSDQLNFSILLFIFNSFQLIKTTISSQREIPIIDEFIQSFIHVLDLSTQFPDVYLLNFFYLWFYFVKQCSSFLNTDKLFERISTITELFELVSKNKYHELHRLFPWYLIFYFYDFIPIENHNHRVKILAMICNGVRRIKRMDSFPRVFDFIKIFSVSLVQQFIDNSPFDLFYMLSSLNSSLNSLTFLLNKLHAVRKTIQKVSSEKVEEPNIDSNTNERDDGSFKKREVSFFEQSNWSINSPQIDKILYANSYEKAYQNNAECANDFNRIVQVCEDIRNHVHSLVILQIQICVCIRKFLAKNELQTPNILNLYQLLLQTFTSLVSFIVQASYKQMEIQSFVSQEVLIGASISPQYLPYTQNSQEMLNFSSAYSKYFEECVFKMPTELLDSLALNVSLILFNFMKKRILTYNFVVTFLSFQKEYSNPNSFINLLVIHMMEIASKNVNLVLSKSIDEANLFFMWILFTIRIAAPLNGSKNHFFGILLKSYQKLIVISVFGNLKSISHQSIAVKMVHFYLEAVEFHFQQIEGNSVNSTSSRIRPVLLENLEETALLDGINVIFDICLDDSDFMPESSLIPLINVAYESTNIELITKASKLCLTIFTPERSNKNPITSVIALEEQVFEAFTNSMNIVDFDTAKRIMEILPYYSSKFLKAFSFKKIDSILTIDFKKLDFYLVLKTISSHLDNSEEEATHLFTFLEISFELVIEKLTYTSENLKPILALLINLVRHCNGFLHLKKPLNKLVSYVTRSFGDLFIQGVSDLYILCVLEVMGINRSDSTSSTTTLAVTFFNYISDKEVDPNYLIQTLNSLNTFFPIPTKFFSILGGFSLFIRFYPQLINLDHIRSLLIQTLEISPLDKDFSSVLNLFLKKFFAKSDREVLKNFVSMVYEIICPLSISVRNVIEKRLSKLRIPLPISNLDSIEKSTDRIIMFQKLTIAFLCGIEGDLIECLNQTWVDRIIQFFKPNSEENIHCFEKYIRVLSFSLAILRDQKLARFFISNVDFFNNLTEFLCSTLLCHFTPVKQSAKKCFKILKSSYYSDLISVRMIDNFLSNPKRLFNFWSSQPEKIDFYTKLTKILPAKTPAELIIDYINGVDDYSQKSDIEKMKLIRNFTSLLKQFTIKEYITLEPVKCQLINGSSYLGTYIQCMLNLYQSTTIPFKTITQKFVIKFLVLFPEQTINYLVNDCPNPTLYNFFFLTDLILNDQSNVFFQSFIQFFESVTDFSQFSIGFISIFEKLSVIELYAKDQLFFTVVNNGFSQIVRMCLETSQSDEKVHSICYSFCISYLNILDYHFELPNIVSLSSILRVSYFNQSDLFQLFKQKVFNSNHQNIMISIIQSCLQSFHNMSLRTIQILLPYSIKALDIKKHQPIMLSNLWSQIIKYLKTGEKVTAILKSIKYLLDKELPEKEQFELILFSIKFFVTSSDTQAVIYSLKLYIKIAEMKLLPPQIFEAILQQLFSFSKFFEIPYFPYFLQLIKKCQNYVDSIGSNAIETISFFFHDRFINLKDIQKNITGLLISTQLYKILPFSIFISICNFMTNKMKTIRIDQSIDEIIEIREVLIYLMPLFQKAETNKTEQRILYKTCFKYLKIILKSSENNLVFGPANIEFNEVLLNSLLKENEVRFPKNYLNLLNNNVNNPSKFSLVCIAAIFEPEFLFTEFSELIRSAIEYIKNHKISKSYLTSFVKFLMNSPTSKLIYIHYQIQINFLVNSLFENLSSQTFEKFYIIINAFVSAHFDSSFTELIDRILSVYFKLNETSKLSNLMFQMILNFIGLIPIEDQLNYIDILMSSEWSLSMKKIFTSSIPSLLSSPTILNNAKKKLISTFSTHIKGNETELLKIIHSVKELGDKINYDVLGTLILLYILIASNSTPTIRFRCFEKIDSLLSKSRNFKEKIRTLLNVLPINLWSDDYFIYVVAILMEKNKFYYAIISFSQRLKNVSSNIAIPIFERNIDDEIIIDLNRFFNTNIIQELKFYYSQFIKTVNLFLIRKNNDSHHYNLFSLLNEPMNDRIDIPLNRLSSKFNDYYLSHLIFPDSFSDSLIQKFLPNSTKRQEMAVFLTHLCKYEAAEKLFIEEGETENQYFNHTRKFNNQFLPNNDLDFERIVRPFIHSNCNEKIIQNLKNCVDSIFARNKEEATDFLNKMKIATLESYRGNVSPTVYQRERFVCYSIIELFIEQFIEYEKIPKFNKENLYQCLNPSLSQIARNFKRYLMKKGPKNEIKIEPKGEFPSILISPLISLRFKEATGVTSHGQYALNYEQITNFFKEIGKKIYLKKFTLLNWISFAPFCFNVFLAQQTLDCFTAAYNAYCQIVVSKNEASITQLNEASARIITLIRISISLNDFTEPIILSSFIFKRTYAKVWHVWLQELVEIATNDWFFNIAIELFTEMAYRSTLYASKFASKEIQESLHHAILNEHSFVQISMMNKIAKILNRINSIPINEIELQSKIQTFINESLRLKEEEIKNINLMEIRHHRNFITPFESALSKLTKSEIERIGNFNNWISTIRGMTNEEREREIQRFTNCTYNLSFLLNDLNEVIDEFNQQMPFIFPIRGNEYNTEFSIFVIHKNIKFFSPEMTTFSSSTSISSKQYFLVMTKKPNGFRPSIISINRLLSLIRTILRSSYSTVARSITLAENYCFEIGSNTILKRLDSEPISFKFFFERDSMMTQEEWINENIENGKLNKKGKENIKSFPKDSLFVFLKNNYGPKSCIFNPHGIAVSYVSVSLIRYIMSAPYPNMSTLIMCAKSLETPVLSIDYNDMKLCEDTPYSNFRFSPSFECMCTIWGSSTLKIDFAAISDALVENLELIRTHLEIILGDEMLMNSNAKENTFSLDEMITKRTIIEKKFIDLAPPKYISNEEESYSWLNKIVDFIEKAKNPWIQPAESIPWY